MTTAEKLKQAAEGTNHPQAEIIDGGGSYYVFVKYPNTYGQGVVKIDGLCRSFAEQVKHMVENACPKCFAFNGHHQQIRVIDGYDFNEVQSHMEDCPSVRS